MRVVVAHNRYQSAVPSGENRIVDSEIELLRSAGVEVMPFIEDSDDLLGASARKMVSAAAGPVISRQAIRRFAALVDEHRPDVLHVHNLFPLISPWVVRAAVAAGIPVVQTVHNYRHTCVAGLHLREGRICDDCRHHAVAWPAIRHACYRGSVCQSAAMVIGQTVHKSTWRTVSRYLVASPHMRERLISTGVRASSVEWRPTYAEDVGASSTPSGGGVAFIGRLDEAKGLDMLLRAWTPPVSRRWKRLVVAGDGPLAPLVEAKAREDPTIEWRGQLEPEDVRDVIRRCELVAIPSLWLEGFPRVAAEAMSIGRPMLMWSGAGFSELAESGAGWVVGGTPEAWTERLLELDESPLLCGATAARRFYEQWCSPSVAVQQLRRVYASVISESSAR
jgi:glycosyltransferase involved in cell wall biosynthesis